MAHTILIIACRLVRDDTTNHDLSASYFDDCKKAATNRHAVRRLERLGYAVTREHAA